MQELDEVGAEVLAQEEPIGLAEAGVALALVAVLGQRGGLVLEPFCHGRLETCVVKLRLWL